MQELVATLKKIKAKLAANVFTSEAAVSLGIIQPMLTGLGWDTADPEQVCPEYVLPGSRIKPDFALFVKGKLRIIIEAKAVGNADNAAPQLFRYTYDAGALLAVLTDGQEWRIYLTFAPGGEKERLVHSLNITERDPQKAAQSLVRYLSFDEVSTGKAEEHARQDLEKQSNRQESKRAIPQAWRELIDKENSPIVESLLNETASNCGHPPDQKDVRDFLHSLDGSPIPPQPPAKPPPPPIQPSGKVSYTLHGKKYGAKNAAEAYANIIQELADRDPSFLKRLEPVFKGEKVRGLARRKEKISSAEDVQRQAKKIIPGWWLHTHLANKAKIRQIKKACEIAGIKFGKDLKVKFPNT